MLSYVVLFASIVAIAIATFGVIYLFVAVGRLWLQGRRLEKAMDNLMMEPVPKEKKKPNGTQPKHA